ncbi:MAG: chemotaxis response regulator protein-glutamate methylesterase [Planctomycetes bacterium]|nr:chemotaxis response regulator protein-glutamate methylesterase [Planctomycetota bacterium]
MRTVLKSGLARSSRIEVIGSAQNGNEALQKIFDLKPDVVTLDIEMPGLSGIEVLERLMKEHPLPVVMVSTKTQEGAQLTFEALDKGAIDFVAKPRATQRSSLEKFQNQVVRAVESAFASNGALTRGHRSTRILRPRKATIPTEGFVVAIGISAGGPATLHKMLPLLPREFPPVVLVQHMPVDFTGPFARRLDAVCELSVAEAVAGEELLPGRVLLAPGNQHLRVARRGGRYVATLDQEPKVTGFRPSVDVLFKSVATTIGEYAIGLVMTGMGCDGAAGVRALKNAGAKTLAQDAESSIVYGMPKAAVETGNVDQVVTLAEIPDLLVRLLAESDAVAAR